MIPRILIVVMLLWAGAANAQETDADAQSPFPCPHAAEFDHLGDMLAWVGDEPEPPQNPEDRRGMEAQMGERGRRLEQLRMRKLQEFLGLSTEQRDKLVPLFRESRREQRQIDERRRAAIEELADEVKSRRPDEGELNALMRKIDDLERQRHEVRKRFLDQARGDLDPVQMAKLVIFEARFEMELLERVRGMRERPGMPRGHRGGPSSGNNPDKR